MKRLIINADDFGYSQETTSGIMEAFQHGLLTNTSLIVNKDNSEEALDFARKADHLGIGIHFNLDDGEPLCPLDQVYTLVDEQGEFHDGKTFRKRLFSARISLPEIYCELEAQLTKFLSFGIQPSHIDFHHHLHLYHPVLEVALQVAKDYQVRRMRTVRLHRIYEEDGFLLNSNPWRKIPADLYRSSLHHKIKRWLKTTDFLLEPKISRQEGSSAEGWKGAIQSLKDNLAFELCCHPQNNQDNPKRIRDGIDLTILKSANYRTLIEKENINLISYEEL
jgi:predicted glycoside hydrolase/deacetylase ChbG (UPF0249 family)